MNEHVNDSPENQQRRIDDAPEPQIIRDKTSAKALKAARPMSARFTAAMADAARDRVPVNTDEARRARNRRRRGKVTVPK